MVIADNVQGWSTIALNNQSIVFGVIRYWLVELNHVNVSNLL
jgi:hypothetical protein